MKKELEKVRIGDSIYERYFKGICSNCRQKRLCYKIDNELVCRNCSG